MIGKAESATNWILALRLLNNQHGIRRATFRGMAPHDLLERTRLFALAVLAFCRKAPERKEVQEAIEQLRKSANSVRSNYRAARKGRSRAEFSSKLHIAFEEADECVDWLEYLKDGKLLEDRALLQEAKELAAILAAADQTARKNSARLKRVPDS